MARRRLTRARGSPVHGIEHWSGDGCGGAVERESGVERRAAWDSVTLLLDTSPSWPITVVRITLEAIFFAHGAQKVLGWFGGYGLKGTVEYFWTPHGATH